MAKILVVDDDATNRLLLATILEAGKHAVLEAAGGDQALELARSERPDIVIADFHMPGMHGVDFIRRLREDAATADIRVIIHTATKDTAIRQFVDDVGVYGVLPKPFEPGDVVRIIAEVLES